MYPLWVLVTTGAGCYALGVLTVVIVRICREPLDVRHHEPTVGGRRG